MLDAANARASERVFPPLPKVPVALCSLAKSEEKNNPIRRGALSLSVPYCAQLKMFDFSRTKLSNSPQTKKRCNVSNLLSDTAPRRASNNSQNTTFKMRASFKKIPDTRREMLQVLALFCMYF